MAFAGVGELHKPFKVKRYNARNLRLARFFSGDNRLSIEAVFFFLFPSPTARRSLGKVGDENFWIEKR